VKVCTHSLSLLLSFVFVCFYSFSHTHSLSHFLSLCKRVHVLQYDQRFLSFSLSLLLFFTLTLSPCHFSCQSVANALSLAPHTLSHSDSFSLTHTHSLTVSLLRLDQRSRSCFRSFFLFLCRSLCLSVSLSLPRARACSVPRND